MLRIRLQRNSSLCPEGRLFGDNAGGTGDLFNMLNAAARSCWKYDQEALMFSSVSEMHPTAVMCWLCVWDIFCVACLFWLPCQISNTLWTMAIWYNYFSSMSLNNWLIVSDSIVFNIVVSPTNILLSADVNFFTMTFWQRVSPVVVESLKMISSRPCKTLPATPTSSGKIENLLRAWL